MKRYIIIFILFSMIIITVDRIVGTFLRHSYDTTHYGAIGRKNLILDSVCSDIIVLGSSRALHHYVPQIIEDSTGMSCYNCGQGGQGIIYNYVLLRVMTERYMPKEVVYEMTFGYDFSVSDNLRFLGEIRNMHRGCSDSVLYAVNSMERVKMLSAIYPYNSQLLHIIGDNMQKKDLTLLKGYEPKRGEVKKDTAYHGMNFNAGKIDPVKWSYFEKMIKEYCRCTHLVVITSPLYMTNHPEIYDKAGRLCRKYGVKFINRSADARFIYNYRYFCDLSHLNDKGARAYTQSIVGELKIARH